MRFAVLGAGAVGGYFGGRLSQAGEDVTFIARGEQLRALNTYGLKVDSIAGDFVVRPAKSTDNPDDVGPVDAILLAVKAWQVPEVAPALRAMLGPDTVVIPLENGVEAPAQLIAVLGAEHVLGGLCGLISFIVRPGHIRHVGAEPFVRFGELHRRTTPRVERLRQTFARTVGVKVDTPPDIEVAMWTKFLLMSSWSGIGAVTRAPIGVTRAQPETRCMLQQAMTEVYEVAKARHIALPQEAIAKAMQFLQSLPPESTASMQRDVIDGRPSELEAQNGAVVRLGREVGVGTPIHSFLYSSLLPMEMKARGQVEFR